MIDRAHQRPSPGAGGGNRSGPPARLAPAFPASGPRVLGRLSELQAGPDQTLWLCRGFPLVGDALHRNLRQPRPGLSLRPIPARLSRLRRLPPTHCLGRGRLGRTGTPQGATGADPARPGHRRRAHRATVDRSSAAQPAGQGHGTGAHCRTGAEGPGDRSPALRELSMSLTFLSRRRCGIIMMANIATSRTIRMP